jgi:hypothetical protein
MEKKHDLLTPFLIGETPGKRGFSEKTMPKKGVFYKKK